MNRSDCMLDDHHDDTEIGQTITALFATWVSVSLVDDHHDDTGTGLTVC